MLADILAVFNLGLIFMALRVTTPILFAALGGVISEQAGVVNVALEGLMLFSALIGLFVGVTFQSPWLGLLGAIVASLLLSLVFAFVTQTLKADEVVVGIAINVFAVGFTVFLMQEFGGDKGSYNPAHPVALPNVPIPWLNGVPGLGMIVNGPNGQGLNVMTYLSLLSVPLLTFFLYRTVFGLRLRSVGESPLAAASVGIRVIRMKYYAILLTGIFTGMAGAFMSMAYVNMFLRNMTAGRGFIALAAVLLGARKPWGTFLAALLFGFAEAISNMAQSLRLPSQLVTMFPYAVTIITLTWFSVRDYRRRQRREAAL
ncbi:MAG: ABC transporter permease [Hydrogenibacillus sp.]|nr:ABC transporter permease [Hydrogenibacillus sp.]